MNPFPVVAILSLVLGLKFDAPKEFAAEAPQSAMQVARYKLPAASGAEDGLLVVYYFGKGMGGSVEDNVKRWIGQFPEKDSEPRVEAGKTASGLHMTIVDVSGTEHAPTPMNPNAPRRPKWRMIGAIIEARDGNYFAKATGPRETLEKHAAAIRAFFSSARE